MEDELFAAKYDNPDKNIDDCVTYILNWVQKSGCNGFCDDEWASHPLLRGEGHRGRKTIELPSVC